MLITYVLIILSFPKGFVESPFLIFVLNTIFSVIFGILEGLFQVFWYSTTPTGWRCKQTLLWSENKNSETLKVLNKKHAGRGW